MLTKNIVGRSEEIEILKEALVSERSELIAVLGRRRVGKTFLIKQVYGPELDFDLVGTQDAPILSQLQNFSGKLTAYSKSKLLLKTAESWKEAFGQLQTMLESAGKKRKRIIFFDELPWLATRRSGFLEAFGYFWNDWASHNKIVIVICGSAASWMIQKISNSKGGLHNRITRTLHLRPFTLHETEAFFLFRRLNLTRYQITQIYMVTGGIPFYLEDIRKGESVAQSIDRLCFSSQGLLKSEFDRLYSSLFDNSELHVAVVRALAGKWIGMTRQELLEKVKLSDGGSVTRLLDELEKSDFITPIPPLDKKKKQILFRLTDYFSLFYLKFMERRRKNEPGSFMQLANMPAWKAWQGYAFENICLMHIGPIKIALGISGVYTETGSYYQKGSNGANGAQIDLLINRADGIISLCEMKFYDAPFTINKTYAAELRNKRETLKNISASKNIYLVLVTCFGLIENGYSREILENSIVIDQLFMQ